MPTALGMLILREDRTIEDKRLRQVQIYIRNRRAYVLFPPCWTFGVRGIPYHQAGLSMNYDILRPITFTAQSIALPPRPAVYLPYLPVEQQMFTRCSEIMDMLQAACSIMWLRGLTAGETQVRLFTVEK